MFLLALAAKKIGYAVTWFLVAAFKKHRDVSFMASSGDMPVCHKSDEESSLELFVGHLDLHDVAEGNERDSLKGSQ